MKLWLISQEVNNGYDTYDSAVVAADTERQARITHPGGIYKWLAGWVVTRPDGSMHAESGGTWADPDQVIVELIGEAIPDTEPGIICASFNAG